jgi:hypothetical protein
MTSSSSCIKKSWPAIEFIASRKKGSTISNARSKGIGIAAMTEPVTPLANSITDAHLETPELSFISFSVRYPETRRGYRRAGGYAQPCARCKAGRYRRCRGPARGVCELIECGGAAAATAARLTGPHVRSPRVCRCVRSRRCMTSGKLRAATISHVVLGHCGVSAYIAKSERNSAKKRAIAPKIRAGQP